PGDGIGIGYPDVVQHPVEGLDLHIGALDAVDDALEFGVDAVEFLAVLRGETAGPGGILGTVGPDGGDVIGTQVQNLCQALEVTAGEDHHAGICQAGHVLDGLQGFLVDGNLVRVLAETRDGAVEIGDDEQAAGLGDVLDGGDVVHTSRVYGRGATRSSPTRPGVSTACPAHQHHWSAGFPCRWSG